MSKVSPIQAPAALSAVREVRAQRTPATPPQIRAAIAAAWQRDAGRAPPASLLDVLTAQVSHETARGDKMYNNNFGGMKGESPTGEVARYRTREVLGGKEVSIVDGFRAYRTLDAGALDYVRTMRQRYPNAIAAAERGDVDGFAAALKARGYFTAHLDDYAASLRSLVHEGPRAGKLTGASSPSLDLDALAGAPASGALPMASTELIGRVLDAVAAAGARVGAPVEEAEREQARRG